MQYIVNVTASLPNYRFFVEGGTFHTFIASDEAVYEPGVSGFVLADWVHKMITHGNPAVWQNVNTPLE